MAGRSCLNQGVKLFEYEGFVTKADDYGCFVTSGNYRTYLYKHQILKKPLRKNMKIYVLMCLHDNEMNDIP